MTLVDVLHGAWVHPRRVRVIAEHAAGLIPPRAHVLDVGSGDGLLVAAIGRRRPDLRIEGIDVLVRPHTHVPVSPFDGRVIPRDRNSVDVVTFFDVLHHTDHPTVLLREAVRVARSCIVIKDHVCDTRFAQRVLGLMDRVGNERHGVALPQNYWTSRQWSSAIQDLHLEPAVWRVGALGLYSWPANLVFGGRLHVLARLDVPTEPDAESQPVRQR